MSRRPLARLLSLTGLWLAAVLTAALWAGVALTLPPAHAALNAARTQLSALDTRLAATQAALAPLDLLHHPDTLAATQALERLARAAQQAPLLDLVLPPQTLANAVTLTQQWNTTLRERPPLPALSAARTAVNDGHRRLSHLQRSLNLTAAAALLLGTLLCAWFAAGQWALYRWATERPNEDPAA